MSRTPSRLGVLLPLCLLIAACDGGYPYNTLDKTRLLAVRADLPELSEGEVATLDALVYSEVPVTYQWSWCPWTLDSNAGFACIVTQEDLDASGLPVPPLDLGTAPEAQFPYPGSAEVVQDLCTLFLEGLPPAGRRHFPDCSRQMPVTLFLEIDDGQHTIRAMKELDLRVDASIVPNVNPAIAAFDAPSEVTVDTAVALTVDVAADAVQAYDSTDREGNPAVRNELLVFTWFWTAGTAENGRTGTVDEGAGLEKARKNTWTSPKNAGPAELIVVVRDDRGGVDWVRRPVTVGGAE